MPEPAVAFLSKRKLHVHRNGVTKVVESDFERSVRERAASIERRHSWKTQGRGAMFTGAWAPQANARDSVPVLLTGLTAREDGALIYSLETDAVSGIFLVDAEGVETRLFHTADLRIRHTSLDRTGTMLAATAFHAQDMRSNIAVIPLHGTDLAEVTDGDSFDQLPHWVPGPRRRVVFQSAGVGRDVAGRFAGLGPCTVQELDVDSGNLDEVASEADHDLLQPRQTEDGTLYYIRKPYESSIPKVSLVGSLQDTVLFPFRMARAVLQYFNIFSMMYTGKPLVTAKGAIQKRLDPRQLFIHGNLAHAQMAQAGDDDSGAAVPRSWELMRRGPGGQPEKIASGVLAYDLASDGSVLYSDGSAILRLSAEGRPERLVKGEQIERVLALG